MPGDIIISITGDNNFFAGVALGAIAVGTFVYFNQRRAASINNGLVDLQPRVEEVFPGNQLVAMRRGSLLLLLHTESTVSQVQSLAQSHWTCSVFLCNPTGDHYPTNEEAERYLSAFAARGLLSPEVPDSTLLPVTEHPATKLWGELRRAGRCLSFTVPRDSDQTLSDVLVAACPERAADLRRLVPIFHQVAPTGASWRAITQAARATFSQLSIQLRLHFIIFGLGEFGDRAFPQVELGWDGEFFDLVEPLAGYDRPFAFDDRRVVQTARACLEHLERMDNSDFKPVLVEVFRTLQSAGTPRVVGVYGMRQVGKSTLLNALLKKQYLPTGDGSAPCTGYAIEIERTEGPLKVEIVYVSHQEWESMRGVLAGTEEGLDNEDEDILEQSIKHRFDSALADGKFRIVGDGDNRSLEMLIGTRETFEYLDDRSMTQKLRKCLSIPDRPNPSNMRSVQAFSTGVWPVVKAIKLSGNFEGLPHGIRLVDMPGVNDTNPLRVHAAREAIRKANMILYVSTQGNLNMRETQNDLRELYNSLTDPSILRVVISKRGDIERQITESEVPYPLLDFLEGSVEEWEELPDDERLSLRGSQLKMLELQMRSYFPCTSIPLHFVESRGGGSEDTGLPTIRRLLLRIQPAGLAEHAKHMLRGLISMTEGDPSFEEDARNKSDVQLIQEWLARCTKQVNDLHTAHEKINRIVDFAVETGRWEALNPRTWACVAREHGTFRSQGKIRKNIEIDEDLVSAILHHLHASLKRLQLTVSQGSQLVLASATGSGFYCVLDSTMKRIIREWSLKDPIDCIRSHCRELVQSTLRRGVAMSQFVESLKGAGVSAILSGLSSHLNTWRTYAAKELSAIAVPNQRRLEVVPISKQLLDQLEQKPIVIPPLDFNTAPDAFFNALHIQAVILNTNELLPSHDEERRVPKCLPIAEFVLVNNQGEFDSQYVVVWRDQQKEPCATLAGVCDLLEERIETIVAPESRDEEAPVPTDESELPILNFDDLTIQDAIGYGGRGKVSKALWKNRAVVVKQPLGQEFHDDLYKEIKVFCQYRKSHANQFVISCLGYCPEPNLCLVLEYCHGMSLADYEDLSLSDIEIIQSQLIAAVETFHEAGFTHRDIKPSNIVLRRPPPRPMIKLIDLDCACTISSGAKTVLGTTRFMPPELLRHELYDPIKADLWSLGLTVWSLYSKRLPFHQLTEQQILQAADECQLSAKLDPAIGELHCANSETKAFLSNCLRDAAMQRCLGKSKHTQLGEIWARNFESFNTEYFVHPRKKRTLAGSKRVQMVQTLRAELLSRLSPALMSYIITLYQHEYRTPLTTSMQSLGSLVGTIGNAEGIYYWRRIRDGKGYVGQAASIRDRCKQHLRDAYKNPSTEFDRELAKDFERRREEVYPRITSRPGKFDDISLAEVTGWEVVVLAQGSSLVPGSVANEHPVLREPGAFKCILEVFFIFMLNCIGNRATGHIGGFNASIGGKVGTSAQLR